MVEVHDPVGKHAGGGVLGQLQGSAPPSPNGQGEEGFLHGAPVIHLGPAHCQAQASVACRPARINSLLVRP